MRLIQNHLSSTQAAFRWCSAATKLGCHVVHVGIDEDPPLRTLTHVVWVEAPNHINQSTIDNFVHGDLT